MKKIILLSIMLLSVLFVNAQRNNTTPEQTAQKRVDRLTKQLNLTDDQQGQMYELVLTQVQNRPAKGKNNYAEMSKEEKTAMKAERKTAKADFDNRVAQILTDEQLTKYQTSGKQRSKSGKKGKGKKNNANKVKANKQAKSKKSPEEKAQKRVDKMTEELGLDARQQDQLFELYANKQPKVKGQSKKDLSKDQRQTMKENRKQANADFDNALAEILTPEQLAKHNALRAEKKGKKTKQARSQN